MDLNSKYDLIERIVNTENESILLQVRHLLQEEETESWEKLSPALKASIQRGIAQADKGEITPHERVMKKIRKNLSK